MSREEKALRYLDLYRLHSQKEIQKAIKSNSNNLATLGLSAYAEVPEVFTKGPWPQQLTGEL